ncbi:hypothetical protein DsansV1_C09g0096631 [Dioscorea sansibarensis]
MLPFFLMWVRIMYFNIILFAHLQSMKGTCFLVLFSISYWCPIWTFVDWILI